MTALASAPGTGTRCSARPWSSAPITTSRAASPRRSTWSGGTTAYAYGWYSYLGTAGLGTFGGWEKITSYANGHASIDDTDYFGRTIWRSNLGGQAFTYSFDKGGRQTAESGPSGYSKTFSWLNTGNLYQLVDAAGTGKNTVTAKYGYDAAGNRTYEGYSGTVYSSYFPSGTTSSTLTLQNATIAYDALNRITSFTDKDAGGTTRITVSNEYDKNGNVRRNNSVFPNLAYPQYGNVNQDKWYRYDTMNRMVVADGALTGGQIVRGALGYNVSYDAAGRRRTQTEDASLTGYSWTWVWYPGHGPGSGAPLEYPDEGNNGQYQEMPVYYMGERREEYEYRADGSLSTVKFAETGYTDNGDGTVSSTGVIGTGVLRAEYQRDAMGRITRYREFQSDGATVSHDRYSIVYANQTFITSESVSQRKVESGVAHTYVTNTVNSYTNGLLMSSTADEWKDGSDSAIPDTSTTNSYAWYDGAQLATSSFDSDTGSGSNTIFVSTYAYDGLGRVASVDIADGRRRTVSFAYTPEGQVLSRKERATASTNPEDMRYFAGGVQIGELTSNGNNDPLLADYAQTVNNIRNWTPNPAAAPFRWNTTGGVTRGTFGAGSGYDPINPYGDGANSTQSSYTVRGGETLQSIAANVWGDAAMWYLLASANGLTGGETLVAGQSLVIPDRVTNIHNNSSTFEVYDPNKAMGDLSPTTPKPPKKPGKCAVLGQILMVVIAVAVTIYTAGALSAAVGPVLAGAIGGAAGSVASQAFGMATGLQKKFDWKGVAMGAISGAVGGAMGPGGAFGKFGAFSSISKVAGGVVQGALKGAITGLVTQGIAVASGLQKKFDWAGIAGDAIGGGISNSMGRSLGFAGAGYAGQGLTGAVSAIASAGARSLIDGTNFGDNILAALPGVIGNTLGNMMADGVQGSGSRGEAEGSEFGEDLQPDNEAAAVLWDKEGSLQTASPTIEPFFGEGARPPFQQAIVTFEGELGGAVVGADIFEAQLRVPPNQQRRYDDQLRAVISDSTLGVDVRRADGSIERHIPGLRDFNIDWNLIKQHEGYTQGLVAYVPKIGRGPTLRPSPTSGVTIGSGFDLAQHSQAEIRALGLPRELTNALVPYAADAPGGVREGQRAENFRLAEIAAGRGLQVTRLEGDAIDAAVMVSKARQVESRYNGASRVPFRSLPRDAQTTIMDFAFQNGSAFGYVAAGQRRANARNHRNTPINPAALQKEALWHNFTSQNWRGAAVTLQYFQRTYRARSTDQINAMRRLSP